MVTRGNFSIARHEEKQSTHTHTHREEGREGGGRGRERQREREREREREISSFIYKLGSSQRIIIVHNSARETRQTNSRCPTISVRSGHNKDLPPRPTILDPRPNKVHPLIGCPRSDSASD